MSRIRLLTAAAAVALTVPASSAVALPGADGAYPLKNTTYKGKGSVDSVGYSAKVTIKVGKDVTKVAKLVARITCPEGKQKFVKKNLAIDDKGYIYWDQRWPVYFFGQFTTRHKVDRGSVKGDDAKPCSSYVLNFDAKD
jgi:hypothetical protein